ncbi:hypothetical protein RM697_05530 [Ichthyenterobacterium sp. W332]|uniref:Lipoprotein n=1 Tax=Microcosmobacter mediterraneus TaxID=3075607 RepID=A0ABU2YIU5_9FLAO|nr:hypothetical protein [Ichthyenterobacterium sp. W332]MDT0558095.1 hypothetical protein [Ichthyenterobacterium sp. W332]
MKNEKGYTCLLIIIVMMITFFNCSSSKQLQKKAPIQFKDVYCQAWAGGIQEAGSGIDIVIPVKQLDKSDIILDSVYFRAKVVQLEKTEFQGITTYIGRFITKPIRNGIVISSDPKEEYKNTVILPRKSPFNLEDHECVVSYITEGVTNYFKIENVIEKPRNNYPSMPKN